LNGDTIIASTRITPPLAAVPKCREAQVTVIRRKNGLPYL